MLSLYSRYFLVSKKYISLSKSDWFTWNLFEKGVTKSLSNRLFKKVRFKNYDSYSVALDQFVKGNSDGLCTTTFETLLALNKGVDLGVVFLLDYTQGSDALIAKRSVTSLTDLKGKRVGVEQNSVAHFTLLKALDKAGLEDSDIHVTFNETSILVELYLHNKLDAISLYDPYLNELKTKGDSHILFSSVEIPGLICDVLILNMRTIKQDPTLIPWLKSIWYKTVVQRRRHVEKSPKGIYITDEFENSVAFGTQAKKGYLYDSLLDMQGFMIKQGLIQDTLDLERIMYYEH
jgi:NitT/TauT family transport system substrate-binding protein